MHCPDKRSSVGRGHVLPFPTHRYVTDEQPGTRAGFLGGHRRLSATFSSSQTPHTNAFRRSVGRFSRSLSFLCACTSHLSRFFTTDPCRRCLLFPFLGFLLPQIRQNTVEQKPHLFCNSHRNQNQLTNQHVYRRLQG